MNRASRWALLVLAALMFPAVGRADDAPLRVSAIPDEAPTELQRKFKPLGEYLEKKIGRKVVFMPVTDYAATVEGVAAKKLDMVWYGGFTFVQANLKTHNVVPIVQRQEDATFHSKFIANANTNIKDLQGLKGHTFAFGSASSTSGHLMPRYFLLKAGINPEKDFSHLSYSGAHDVTAKWVEAGKVDAGVLNESVYQKMLDEKKLDPNKIRLISTTPPYYDYNWTVRADLDPKLIQAIKDAFLSLDYNKPEDKAIMDLQRTKKFIPTAAENYKSIEEAARSAGLLKE